MSLLPLRCCRDMPLLPDGGERHRGTCGWKIVLLPHHIAHPSAVDTDFNTLPSGKHAGTQGGDAHASCTGAVGDPAQLLFGFLGFERPSPAALRPPLPPPPAARIEAERPSRRRPGGLDRELLSQVAASQIAA